MSICVEEKRVHSFTRRKKMAIAMTLFRNVNVWNVDGNMVVTCTSKKQGHSPEVNIKGVLAFREIAFRAKL